MEKEIAKIFNKFSTAIGTICTMLTSTFGIEWVLFAGYLLLNITDYLTGTIKAKMKNVENSNKGLIGIIKKIWLKSEGIEILVLVFNWIIFFYTISTNAIRK